jgi:AcrR family transcriptional regulator
MNPIIVNNQIILTEKQKIFTHFKSRFLKNGFYNPSIESISSELKISKKTFYKHFPSKDSIVREIIKSIMLDMSSRVDAIIKSEEDAVSKSVKLLNTISSLLLQVGERWLDDLRIHTPELWQDIEDFRAKKLYNTLSSIIEQGKKEKLFTEQPVEIVISIFLSSLSGIVNQEFLFHNRFSYREAVQKTLEILFTGILTPKGLKLFYKSLKKVQDENL